MTNYVEHILDLWGHNQIVDMAELTALKKQYEALQLLFEAKQKEAAELRVRATTIEPVGESGKQPGRKAV